MNTPANPTMKDLIITQLEMRIDALESGIYTAEDLCGNEFWSLLGSGQQKLTGTIISGLVKSGYFNELSSVKWEHEYPLKYKLVSAQK